MPIIEDFLINLAVGFTQTLLTHLGKRLLGDPQRRALQRAYQAGFQAMLRTAGQGLSQAELGTVAAVIGPFVNQPEVATALLDCGLSGDPLDTGALAVRWQAQGASADLVNIRFDFGRGLLAFQQALTTALIAEAGRPDSPLANQVVVNRLVVLQGQVQQLYDLFQQSAARDAEYEGRVRHSTGALRELLITALTGEDLTRLAYDHFRPVYEQFAAGQSRTQRVQLLVEYCERQKEQERLLARVQEINPARYAEYEGRVRHSTGSLDTPQRERLNVRPQEDSRPAIDDKELRRLRRLLNEAWDNLQLIEERFAQYVLQVDVPLQLVKEKKALQARIAELEGTIRQREADEQERSGSGFGSTRTQ